MFFLTFIRYIYAAYTLLFVLSYLVAGSPYLKAATVIFRHGERNPIRTYPGDPYSNASEYWPQGYGIMTEHGKLQIYNLGKYLKTRYSNVPDDNLVVFSSEKNRTITSANLMLNGYFSNLTGDADLLAATAIAHKNKVTVIPLDLDDFIFVSQPCPKYFRLRDEYRNLTGIDLFGGWKPEVDIISRHTGMAFDPISFDLNLFLFTDTLLIQKYKNLTLPPWAEELYNRGAIHGIRSFYYVSSLQTDEMTRLYTGSIMSRFLESMDQIVEDNSGVVDTTLSVISGHDTTIAFWLTNLGLSSSLDIPFAAALLLELYQTIEVNGEKEFHIKVFYRNGTDSDPMLLNLPGCSTPCLYSKFKKLMEPRSLRNREEHCKLSDEGVTDNIAGNLNQQTLLVPTNLGGLTVNECYSVVLALLSLFV